MVGRLSLQAAAALPDTKRRGERALDSPDSGLPPSPGPGPGPGPGPWPRPPPGAPEPEPSPVFSPGPLLSSGPPRLWPLSFGEGVELDPVPPKEVRYTSSVTYDSEKHFIDDIYMPMGLGLSACSQTVICVPDCTWRSYKSEVRFEPRNKPLRFSSTTIVYPKHTKTVFTTTLDYNCRKAMRRFLSSVELESSECAGSDCLLDGC